MNHFYVENENKQQYFTCGYEFKINTLKIRKLCTFIVL